MSAVTNTQTILRETAQRIVNESKSIETIIYKLFKGVIEALEDTIKKQLPLEARNRVWAVASAKSIAVLKTSLIEELNEKVFNELPDGKKLEDRMLAAYSASKKQIVSFIEKKTNELFHPFVKDILAAVKKEGFEVPEYE